MVKALGGQFRVTAVDGRLIHTGYDMTAALALADAMAVPTPAVAEFLPLIEACACAAMNRMDPSDG